MTGVLTLFVSNSFDAELFYMCSEPVLFVRLYLVCFVLIYSIDSPHPQRIAESAQAICY